MENFGFEPGLKIHIQSTMDFHVLYCQKNPTLLSLKISKFFTIIDTWTWIGFLVLSLFLGITKFGGYSDIAATFLRVAVLSR